MLAATVEATTAAVMNPQTEKEDEPEGGFRCGEGQINVSSADTEKHSYQRCKVVFKFFLNVYGVLHFRVLLNFYD